MQKVDEKKLSKSHALYLASVICGEIEKGFKTLEQRVSAGESNDFIILGAGHSIRNTDYTYVKLEPYVWGITETAEDVKRRYCFYLLRKNYLAFAKSLSLEEVANLVALSSVRAKEFLAECHLYTNIEGTVTKERRKLSAKRSTLREPRIQQLIEFSV